MKIFLMLIVAFIVLAGGYLIRPAKPFTKEQWEEFKRINPQIIVDVSYK